MTFASITNIAVAALCVAVLFQSVRMMRSIRAIKSNDLTDTIKSLDRATAQARAVLANLKDLLSTDGAANIRTIASGEALRDELSLMVGIGNAVADRIMDAAAAAGERKKEAEALAPALPSAPKRSRRRRAAPKPDAVPAPAAARLQ